MLEFSEEFFKAEEREAFYVDEMMKRYWACLMEILCVIDSICKKYHIKYYASWGTLLGAARHGGFVPWDDDIDLALKRPDYEKLLKILPKELPKGWRVSSIYNNKNHDQLWAGVSNAGEINLSEEHLKRFHGCPFAAVIDLFPLDYLPRDKDEAELISSLITIIWNAVNLIKANEAPEIIEESICDVETYLNVKIDRNQPMVSQLWRLANLLAQSYGEKDGDILVQWTSHINWGFQMNKDFYDETIWLPFEQIKVPAPKRFEEALECMYKDWKTPHQFSQAHEYPCYKNQLEKLKKVMK